MNFYKDEAKKLKDDLPEVFGLHFNAEISTQIQDNLILLENIRTLSPELYSTGQITKEEIVLPKAQAILKEIPGELNIDQARKRFIDRNSKFDPVLHCLFQEAGRYNYLINLIRTDLLDIESAITGLTVFTPTLENLVLSIFEDKVPLSWMTFYSSTKSFVTFIHDFKRRVEFFSRWLENGFSPNYILGYFSNPTGFITSVKQKFSLDNKKFFYNIGIDFKIINDEEEGKLANGYVLKDVWLEGGKWDKKDGGGVRDEAVQELYFLMPPILMTPHLLSGNEQISNNIASSLNANNAIGNTALVASIKHCFPIYYIPIRGEYLGRSSYVTDIWLNIFKDKDKDGVELEDKYYIAYWIKKSTCLLLSRNDL
jgi:dynein heavy chain